MRKLRASVFMPVALCVGVALAPAAAESQTAPAPVIAKPDRATSRLTVVVTNTRAFPLIKLYATPVGGSQATVIAANLAPGQKASVSVGYGKSCVFNLHGDFADGRGADLTNVDLCKDNKITLIE